MKNVLLSILIAVACISPVVVNAQSFSIQADTVYGTIATTGSIFDTIATPASVSLKWRVVASNFPADWLMENAFGLCDATLCRPNTGGQLWTGTSGALFTCTYPGTGNSHNYDLQMDLTNASSGTHYVTVSISDPTTAYAKTMTFIVNKPHTTAIGNVSNGDNDVTIYPNPAREELNILFNANSDVHNIAVYNIIGKVVMVYKVTGDSANLNLENIPAGVYFVRLTNSRGEMVTTKKFTKQ